MLVLVLLGLLVLDRGLGLLEVGHRRTGRSDDGAGRGVELGLLVARAAKDEARKRRKEEEQHRAAQAGDGTGVDDLLVVARHAVHVLRGNGLGKM